MPLAREKKERCHNSFSLLKIAGRQICCFIDIKDVAGMRVSIILVRAFKTF